MSKENFAEYHKGAFQISGLDWRIFLVLYIPRAPVPNKANKKVKPPNLQDK